MAYYHKAEGLVDHHSLHFVLDTDMAILGVEQQYYEQYCQAVRHEFKSVPGISYRRGRKSFLKSVLDQDKIYISNWFYNRFEKQARINVDAELSRL